MAQELPDYLHRQTWHNLLRTRMLVTQTINDLVKENQDLLDRVAKLEAAAGKRPAAKRTPRKTKAKTE